MSDKDLGKKIINLASLVAQVVKDLPAMQETQVQSLGREDPLEEGMATHSSTLAWTIPWMEEPGQLQSMGLQRVTKGQQVSLGCSGGTSGKENTCQCRRHERPRFSP